MAKWLPTRGDTSVGRDKFNSAEDYYAEIRRGFREKADHNKNESQRTFVGIIVATLLSPLFVTLGDGFWAGKAVPAALSVAAACATAWLQLRKPQRLWAIYRRAQRELEREKTAYDFKLDDYGSSADPDKLLAARVSAIAFKAHQLWEGLVPDPDALTELDPAIPSKTREE